MTEHLTTVSTSITDVIISDLLLFTYSYIIGVLFCLFIPKTCTWETTLPSLSSNHWDIWIKYVLELALIVWIFSFIDYYIYETLIPVGIIFVSVAFIGFCMLVVFLNSTDVEIRMLWNGSVPGFIVAYMQWFIVNFIMLLTSTKFITNSYIMLLLSLIITTVVYMICYLLLFPFLNTKKTIYNSGSFLNKLS